jgi:hypothetical protein
MAASTRAGLGSPSTMRAVVAGQRFASRARASSTTASVCLRNSVHGVWSTASLKIGRRIALMTATSDSAGNGK